MSAMLNLLEVNMRGFTKTQVAGFLITGAAIGAVATLLFAPKSGVQVRKDIRRFSKRTMDQLEDLQCDLRDQINEGYAQVRRMIKTA
jgi:gas vesicle protein